ncbi:MAG TPA: ABC transporter ATP-binding protein [Actinomycetota bacterium]|nr:ABC transporter ATP-binding protein [Actinomycetota bacterium]
MRGDVPSVLRFVNVAQRLRRAGATLPQPILKVMIGHHMRHLSLDDKSERPTLPKDLWRRVLRFARPHRRKILVFLLTVVVGSLLALVPPKLMGELVEALQSAVKDRDRGQAPPASAYGLVNLLGLTVVLLALVNTGLSLVSRWYSARIGESVIFDLRAALFDRVQRMPIAFFTRTQTGALISRLNNDVVGAQGALTNTLGGIVSNAVTVVFTLAAMVWISWQLTLLALIVLPAFILPSRRVGRRLQAATREQMNLNASMNTTMTERFNVSGALLVKLFGDADAERDEFSARAARVRDIGVRLAVLFRTFFLGLGLVGAVGTAAVYWVGGRMVLSGGLGLGELVTFAAYVAAIYSPIANLTNARVDLMTAFVSFDRVFEILDLPQPLKEKPEAKELDSPSGHVRFEQVWFRYPAPEEVPIGSLEGKVEHGTTSDWILRDLSFEIRPGQMVALVGPSGAGKTTISSLVPRLYDVTRGTVVFDGVDVRDLRLGSLAGAIGIVTQDAHMFHDSLRANLLYARPDASEEEMVRACRAARIHDLIASLPEGYDTVVGERGYRLSGGEKQRVAIARVLLKDPALVILDEATAHLDSESESLIQRALSEALSGRSSLVIAHRLSTIVAADTILVIDGGRIVQRGTHAELVAAGGLYSELYRTQFQTSAV